MCPAPMQTGFARAGASSQYDYQQRRTALRETWFPADQESLDRVQKETSVVLRFVIGHSKEYKAEREINAEQSKHGGFLRLPIQVLECALSVIAHDGSTRGG